MANTAANVLVGKPLATGGVLIGPTGTSLPTNATTAPDAALLGAGYIGSDGVVETNDDSTQKITAWGGDTVRVVRTEYELTYKFTLIETASAPLKLFYGSDNVTVAEGLTTVEVNGTLDDSQVFVLEIKDNGKKVRIVIPSGTVTKREDVSYTDSDAVGYGVTISCTPDESGNSAYKYISADSASSSSSSSTG